MKSNPLPLLAIATLLTGSVAIAQVSNPNFDTDLTGWTISGDVAVRDSGAYLTTATSIPPGDDGSTGFNFSGLNVSDSFTLEGFAGLTPGDLDPDPDNLVFAFEGSAIQQTFDVEAGDFIGFSWQLFTNEVGGDDYAFVVLDGVLLTLGTSTDATAAGSYSFNEQTGIGSYLSSTYSSNQTVTLTIGVVDAGLDGATSTALRIDTVTIPEPSTYALLGLALLAGAFVWRRRVAGAEK